MAGLHRLNALQVKNAKRGAALADGGGLYLRTNPSEQGRWVFRFTLKGQKQREMGLGAIGDGVTLANVRAKAAEAYALVAAGIDPITHAEEQGRAAAEAAAGPVRGITFGEYIDLFLPERLTDYGNAKHRYQWEYSLRTDATSLQDMEPASITRTDVLNVLQPIWNTEHVTTPACPAADREPFRSCDPERCL